MIQLITSSNHITSAAELSGKSHRRLRELRTHLPIRSSDDFASRIDWTTQNGIVTGLFEGGKLQAFLGAIPIDDIFNSGPGSIGPDWCNGAAAGVDDFRAFRLLYRDLAPRFISTGHRIHAFGCYASEAGYINAMQLTGFGRVTLDAARPLSWLIDKLSPDLSDPEFEIVRARAEDAPELERLDNDLASHLTESPVFIPVPHGMSSVERSEWLASPLRISFIARRDRRVFGYIKAEEPQYDVSFAVQGRTTLAIKGLYVEPEFRRSGIGSLLLGALACEGRKIDREIMSVDCETTNIEAYAFWTKWFDPVTYGLERRTSEKV